jgi:hypothetical protein
MRERTTNLRASNPRFSDRSTLHAYLQNVVLFHWDIFTTIPSGRRIGLRLHWRKRELSAPSVSQGCETAPRFLLAWIGSRNESHPSHDSIFQWGSPSSRASSHHSSDKMYGRMSTVRFAGMRYRQVANFLTFERITNRSDLQVPEVSHSITKKVKIAKLLILIRTCERKVQLSELNMTNRHYILRHCNSEVSISRPPHFNLLLFPNLA